MKLKIISLGLSIILAIFVINSFNRYQYSEDELPKIVSIEASI